MNSLFFGWKEIMLMQSGVCLMLTLITLFMRFDSKVRKLSLIFMELFSFTLLLANRQALISLGDTSEFGFAVTHISFNMIPFLLLLELGSFNTFLASFCIDKEKKPAIPVPLFIPKILLILGILLLCVNLFTGFIFRISEENTYVRGSGYLICNLVFFLTIAVQMYSIMRYLPRMNRRIRITMFVYDCLIVAGAVAQYLLPGLSFNALSFACLSIVLHICAVYDNGRKLVEARNNELNAIRTQEEALKSILNEMAGSLAGAIDAKDAYTSGHSRRVAEYAREIARRTGKNEEECDFIYLAGLLHDVGKIGVPNAIINKPGRLTDEEFDTMKQHTRIGDHILMNIQHLPLLHQIALSHHERYDAKGYPDQIGGDEIPEYARIIAVADSYDAMTSNRSYRKLIPQQIVRQEIEKGKGTQFDPRFADCMLRMIDDDPDYNMREK